MVLLITAGLFFMLSLNGDGPSFYVLCGYTRHQKNEGREPRYKHGSRLFYMV